MKRLFFVGGRMLATVDFPDPESSKLSLLWYCYRCGEVYARVVTEDEGKIAAWTPRQGCCSKCSPNPFVNRLVPGSIWDRDSLTDYNDTLPEAVMKREFELTIKAKEEGII